MLIPNTPGYSLPNIGSNTSGILINKRRFRILVVGLESLFSARIFEFHVCVGAHVSSDRVDLESVVLVVDELADHIDAAREQETRRVRAIRRRLVANAPRDLTFRYGALVPLAVVRTEDLFLAADELKVRVACEVHVRSQCRAVQWVQQQSDFAAPVQWPRWYFFPAWMQIAFISSDFIIIN